MTTTAEETEMPAHLSAEIMREMDSNLWKVWAYGSSENGKSTVNEMSIHCCSLKETQSLKCVTASAETEVVSVHMSAVIFHEIVSNTWPN
jgi:hypothetical protein